MSSSRTLPSPSLVVGIGLPGGDLDVVATLLAILPQGTGWAFVIAVPEADLDRLRSATTIPIVAAEGPLEADRIHALPSPAIAVDGDRVLVVAAPSAHPVDAFFASLAEVEERAVAVLVGDGDGRAGLAAISARGGLALEVSASGDRHASVSAVAEVPAAIARQARVKRTDPSPGRLRAHDLSESLLHEIAAVLHERRGVDATSYKPSTVRRRVLRRMALGGFGHGCDYLQHLRADATEQQRLVDDLLISVTDFFRDPEALATLDESVLRPLVASTFEGRAIRAWVAGCASGEEAYTLAILLNEAIRSAGTNLSLEVFATDVDEDAVAVARRGWYPSAIAERVPPSLLERYFERGADKGFQVRPHLRAQISFALHDLVRTAPFSRMHLVSCRNVLIYLAPEAQGHVLRSLHFALRSDGHLFLGSSESAGDQGLFEPISKRWRIYRKKEVDDRRALSLGGPPPMRARVAAQVIRKRLGVGELARRAVLEARVPPTLVVSGEGDVLFMHGELRPYLRFPDGDPRFDLNAIVAPELATRVRAALVKCRRDGGTVVVRAHAESHEVEVTASPAAELGPGAVVLSFAALDGAGETATLQPPQTKAEENLVDQLERELRATQDDLRHTVEELESSNDALRAANEEASSMNEELQSANEELEATTEELRSVNDELTSVNIELRDKVDQMERAHDDLVNFFASTHIATLFLDDQLAIKRFTPAAAELLRLAPGDVGRPIDDIARELLQNKLAKDARAVLTHLSPRTREVRTKAGRWLVRRVLPYRTEIRKVEGVVVTLVDVTDLKRATERLAVRERQQAVIARLGLEALEEPDLQQFMSRAVREIPQVLGTDYCELLELQPDGESLLLRAGTGWKEGLVGTATVRADLESHAGFTVKGQAPVFVADFAVEKRFAMSPLLRDHGVTSGLSCVIRGGSGPYGVLGVHTRARRELTEEDGNFLVAMAAVIAAAIARNQATTRLLIESAVAQVISEATSRDELIAGVFSAFEAHFAVAAGEVWEAAEDGFLEATTILSGANVDEERLRTLFGHQRFRPGEGFVGRVWQRGAAEWVTKFQAPPGFLRQAAASELGLASALAFPLAAGGKPMGIFSVFTRELVYVDPSLLRSLESIGRGMGETLRRLAMQTAVRRSEEVASEALRRGEERYRNLFEGAGVSLWEKDFSAVVNLIDELRASGVSDFRRCFAERPELVERAIDLIGLRDVNERTVELLGASRKEDLLGSLRTTFFPESREVFVEELVALAEGKTLVTGTTVRRSLRGDRIDVAVTVRFPPAPGPYDRVPVSLTDVSPLKRAQAQSEESRRWFNRLAEATPDQVAVYDVERERIVWSNRGLEDEAHRHLVPDDGGVTRAFYRSVAEAADPTSERIHLVQGEGDRWLQIRAVPFDVAPEGAGRQVLVVARDVTDLKQTERSLLEANRQKDDFLAMLGHELRNPLAAVRNAAELLRLAEGDARVKRVQAVLDRQTHHMAKLIDGLLDVSRIIRGKIEIAHESVDLTAVVSDIVDDYRERFQQREVELVREIADDHFTVVGDRVRLAQIADNLLSNALKFTPPQGRVTVRLRREGDLAILEIEDTGVGIDPATMSSVFQTFWQAEQTIDRSVGGLGLGLALVRGLVDLHGGEVTVFSEGIGRGARFEVVLPIRAMPIESTAAPDSHVPPLRVLIVEDHADASLLLAQILESDGHQVQVVADGREAVERVKTFRPHAVLCDIGLPGMSGHEVAQAVRRFPRGADLLLVALSGYGRREDRKRSLRSGFDVHLTKPISAQAIRSVLARSARRHAASS